MNRSTGNSSTHPTPYLLLYNKHHEWEMVFFFPLAHVNGWRNASKGGCLRSKLDSSLSFMPPSGLFRSLVSVAALVVLSPLTTFKPTVTTFVSATTCFFLDYFSSVPVLVDSSRILNLWNLLSTLQSKEWPWKLPILASGSSKDHWILYLLWSLDLRQSHLGGGCNMSLGARMRYGFENWFLSMADYG